MHPVVKSFREKFVEGRFVIPFTILFVIGMRVVLYIKTGLPETTKNYDNYLWRPVAYLFENPLLSFSASTLSVILISWILFTINNRFGIIRSRSNLPFTTPMFLLSLHPYFLVMTGNYIAIVFILFAFIPLLGSYQKPDSYLYSFRSSIMIAVASLFQVYALVLIPLWWRGERTMRGPQLRSFLASLFGAFLVYISVFSVYVLLDSIPAFLLPLYYFIAFSIPDIPGYTLFEWGAVLFIVFFFVINMFLSIKEYARDKVVTLNLLQFIVFLVIFLLLLQIIYWEETLFFILLSATLISFVCSYLYSKTTSNAHIYLAYSMLFVLILFYISQYFPNIF